MADKALVTRLSACETMGSATTICSDKTGTLTLNLRIVVEAYICGKKIDPPNNKSELLSRLVSLLIEAVAQNSTRSESDIKWASGWDTYLLMNDDQIHWFSIINSLMIVLFLSGKVAIFMIRILYRHIANYNHLNTQDEAQEETGWKLVHGDVFRAPEYSRLLSVYVRTEDCRNLSVWAYLNAHIQCLVFWFDSRLKQFIAVQSMNYTCMNKNSGSGSNLILESDIKWASGWDTYLLMNDDQIHWFSIINSLMIVLFLSGKVAMIMMRTLYRDIANYNTQDEVQEETGWKLVHGDFSELQNILDYSRFTLGPWWAYDRSNRGGLLTAMVLLWVFMSLFGGYPSARIYKMFKERSGRTNENIFHVSWCLIRNFLRPLCIDLGREVIWSSTF
ncbi:hypothetical protein CTI12_AA185980 [Artemisia annua]|uniref:Transmembrane 9 superfamily member n=1 Tax=Artemisia annua TaxID=35608 RepID=A0A2U1P707_ARTAN|nr:hypothetical protein CTI12_AA185980 [Artemisia annua]